MEREQDRWKRIYRNVRRIAGIDPNTRHLHQDSLIAGVLLWAAANDRPMYWACDPRQWPDSICPRELPSQSCMSRRLRTQSMMALLERIHQELREGLPSGVLKFIDAKPLPVGGCTKDVDATYGRAASCKARGYKIYAIYDAVSGAADHWLLGPMNWSEQKAADILLAQLPPGVAVVGDGEYDSSRAYDVAASRESALLACAPMDVKGTGHHYLSPHRSNGLALARSSAGLELLMARIGIEQALGNFSCCHGGLAPLPAWVRTPHRVAAWVAAKFLIDLDRRIQLTKQKASAA
jgi:hypothetical protein